MPPQATLASLRFGRVLLVAHFGDGGLLRLVLVERAFLDELLGELLRLLAVAQVGEDVVVHVVRRVHVLQKGDEGRYCGVGGGGGGVEETNEGVDRVRLVGLAVDYLDLVCGQWLESLVAW